MRISSLNITTQPGRASHARSRESVIPQERRAPETKQQPNSSAAIIEAEYVDLYRSGVSQPDKERVALDITLEPEVLPDKPIKSATTSKITSDYQLSAAAVPPPGTLVDIFA